jgi:hypothetical protein
MLGKIMHPSITGTQVYNSSFNGYFCHKSAAKDVEMLMFLYKLELS